MAENKVTFEEFKDSFFYGERSDLNFKFLAHLPEEEAGRFFKELLQGLGSFFNDGDVPQLMDLIGRWQARGYANEKNFEYTKGPFTRLDRSVDRLRLGLLTSSGHFVKGDDPKPLGIPAMTQEEAEARIMEFVKTAPHLSVIPRHTPEDQLKVRHGGYDVSGAILDPNVAFPLALLRRLADTKRIGELALEAYSFVGACSQIRLLKHIGPKWVDHFQAQGIEAVLLVPVWPVCHVSVGHVARLLEEAGIATVIVAVQAFAERMRMMTLPRVLLTPHPMGRPLGPPGNEARQMETITVALNLLESATAVGTIKTLEGGYHPVSPAADGPIGG